MQFTPKTEEEAQAEQLCAEGLYGFTVMESAEVKSKSTKNAGKPMIKLKLNIAGDDADYHVYDYIADWFMAHKFRHFFYAIGMGKQYESGNIDAANNALAGRQGWADVGIQKAKGEYPAKNIIRDFKPQEEAEEKPKAAPANQQSDEDDSVPF